MLNAINESGNVMEIEVKGKFETNTLQINGLAVDNWTEVRMEISHSVINDAPYTRISMTGIEPKTGSRLEMAEISIHDGGRISVAKPIHRFKHDHNNRIMYKELRGVSRNKHQRRSFNEPVEYIVDEKPLSVIPDIVDY